MREFMTRRESGATIPDAGLFVDVAAEDKLVFAYRDPPLVFAHGGAILNVEDEIGKQPRQLDFQNLDDGEIDARGIDEYVANFLGQLTEIAGRHGRDDKSAPLPLERAFAAHGFHDAPAQFLEQGWRYVVQPARESGDDLGAVAGTSLDKGVELARWRRRTSQSDQAASSMAMA
jgi:hypothetical protein